MPQLCFYLHLHQPYRLKDYNVFAIGNDQSYFADEQNLKNQQVFLKVAHKSYFPMLGLLERLLTQHSGFKFALSISGMFIEQAQLFAPEVLVLLQKLVKTGRVELLAETYYHSLAFLYSNKEFVWQINKHQQLIEELFGVKPRVFRNTELVYYNDLVKQLADFQFQGILTEAVDRYLAGHQRTQLFQSHSQPTLPLLLKHAQLSDDIAFRFSDKSWPWYPLQVEQYLDWIEIYPENELVNLFMDFETFGEHQWADTGIFEFFASFVAKFLQKPWNQFKTPQELFARFWQNHQSAASTQSGKRTSAGSGPFQRHQQQSQGYQQNWPVYDVPEPISWADVDRDLTAWRDNQFQYDSLRVLYELEQPVLESGDPQLIQDWRRLQTSDHFYYMCTKWSADGDVHAYFSPYDSPQEAYRRYSIVLADLKERLL
ncbi:MAG: alpha-amylase [Candidatus Pacebacteria bacterium]|nr:alpha-amylase [Candidatus Paceibacterota bacterium]